MRMTASWFGSNAIHRIQGCCGALAPHSGRLPSDHPLALHDPPIRDGCHDQRLARAVMTSQPTADGSAVLDPVQDAFRAGFAGAASGILDRLCARRSAGRRSGRRDGRKPSNKGMGISISRQKPP